MIFLTIENDKVVAKTDDNSTFDVSSFQDIRDLMESYNDSMVMCSSSLDWPCDETSNKETIRFACKIRGNNYYEIVKELDEKENV